MGELRNEGRNIRVEKEARQEKGKEVKQTWLK
jgi:hypothetical protein